ncbi:MAG: glycosyl transferase group 1 [Acidimicrobiales bacterium]|nr:glycosyl transferase group 1 [Acidimicrobiales bacterium]
MRTRRDRRPAAGHLPRGSHLPGARPTVLFVVTNPVTLRFLRGHVRALASHGWEVGIVSSPGPALGAFVEAEGAVGFAVPIHREVRLLADVRSLCRLVRLLRAERPDMVHVSTPKAGLLGMVAAALTGVPVRCFQLRGLRFETTSGAKRQLLIGLDRLTCSLAHAVVCNGASLRSSAIAAGVVAADKAVVLGSGSSNGVEVPDERRASQLSVLADGLRAELDIPAGAFTIGVASRLTRDKGVEDVRHVMELVRSTVPAAHLVIVGAFEDGDPVPEESRSWLQSQPWVHLVGQVDEVDPYYRLMDVLLFPSYREGMPNAPLEAAAAGVPVCGYAVTGTVDAVLHGRTGMLRPSGDTRGLAADLVRYASEPELARQHGASGRARVLMEFRREDVQAKHRSFYRGLLDAPTGAAIHVPEDPRS